MVEAKCWAAPWGINNPNFKSSEGIHVLPDWTSSWLCSQGDEMRLGFWDETDRVSAVQSIQSSQHLPDHPAVKQGHLLREKSVLSQHTKVTSTPQNWNVKIKLTSTDRTPVGILHLYCILWFISCPREMEKVNTCLFWIMLVHFLWHKATLLAILWKEEFAYKAEGGLTKTESPVCWSGILATTGN